MGRVVWSPTAISDLEAVHDYIARDSPPLARAFAERLRGAIRHLAEFPLAGRIVPEMGRKDVREVLVQRYRVLYRVKADEAEVEILTIRHGARLLGGIGDPAGEAST